MICSDISLMESPLFPSPETQMRKSMLKEAMSTMSYSSFAHWVTSTIMPGTMYSEGLTTNGGLSWEIPASLKQNVIGYFEKS